MNQFCKTSHGTNTIKKNQTKNYCTNIISPDINLSRQQINENMLSRNFNLYKTQTVLDNRILSNEEKKKLNINPYDNSCNNSDISYKNIQTNNSRSDFNVRFSKLRPFPKKHKKLPYFNLMPKNTRYFSTKNK